MDTTTSLIQRVSNFLFNTRLLYSLFSENFKFVDYDSLNGRRSNATGLTDCPPEFRRRLIERDGYCVVSGFPARHCDATSLIPRAKGDEVNVCSRLMCFFNDSFDSTSCRFLKVALPVIAHHHLTLNQSMIFGTVCF